MGPENNVGLGGCWIKECLLPYLCMLTVLHIIIGLEIMLDYRGVGLARFYCMYVGCMCIGHDTSLFCNFDSTKISVD